MEKNSSQKSTLQACFLDKYLSWLRRPSEILALSCNYPTAPGKEQRKDFFF